MNIIVKPYGSNLCYCRPDTTWERENKDFYSPECVNEIYWTPVVFARVSKAGKCVGRKFVERYYDGVGCGILLYCGTSGLSVNSGDPRSQRTESLLATKVHRTICSPLATPNRGWHVTSAHLPIQNTSTTPSEGSAGVRCLSEVADRSSILPYPLFQPVVLESEKEFVVSCQHEAQDDAAALRQNIFLSGTKDILEDAICNASQLTSLRIGDFVAVELRELQKLASREEANIVVKGEFCEKDVFSFNIVF